MKSLISAMLGPRTQEKPVLVKMRLNDDKNASEPCNSQLLIKKGVFTEKEWRKANQP